MLKKILGNTLISVILVVLSVVYIIATFRMRTEWGMTFDMFFAFMAAFCHLMATLFTKMIPAESKRMDRIALAMFIIAVVSGVAELVAFYCC